MRFYDCFNARNNFAFNKELIEEITPGDLVKCAEHDLSVERVYILFFFIVKGDRGRGRS